MIRIALVEDDEQYRREFLDYLKQYQEQSGEHFRISVFTDGDEIAEAYQADYDLILRHPDGKRVSAQTSAYAEGKLPRVRGER